MYRILIVDDEMVFRKGIAAMLRKSDFSLGLISEAVDGCEALELLEQNDYDMILHSNNNEDNEIEKAVSMIEPRNLDSLLHPQFDADALAATAPVAKALAAAPGAACGKIVFSAEDAQNWNERGEKVVLVRLETSPEDITGMKAAQGVLTVRGGMTSHAAVVARGMGRCCVSGCGDIAMDEENKKFTLAGKEYHVQSGNSGALADYNLEGRMLLYYFLSRNMSFGFLETRKLSGIQCTALELEGEYEKIPFSGQELADLEFLEEKRHYHVPVKRKMKRKIGRQTGRKETFTVQIPCRQEHGATAYQEREITYYINHIKLVDGWTKAKEKCDEMKAQGILSDEKEYQMFLNHLKEICPPGMRNLAVEYECEDASLEFYTREQLQEKQKIREGEGATAFFLAGNRVKGEGIHGMKLRGCMIQYPVQPDITEADLELLCAFLIL